MTTIYTIEEVARHNNAKDLWIVVHNGVYNITEFRKEHPGGEDVLLEVAGQDATDRFESNGHSFEAVNLRESFKIGELAGSVVGLSKSKTTKTEVKESMKKDEQNQELNTPKTEASWNLMTLIFIAVPIYAIIFYWFSAA